MASIKVQPNIDVLSWAVKRSRVDLHSKFKQLDRWLSGEEHPTLHQLEEFAKAASVPFGYLFLNQPPDEHIPIPHFRTLTRQLQERPSTDLLETIYIMQRRQEWMREYLIGQGYERLPFIGSCTTHDDPHIVAQRIREKLNIDTRWASTYRTWIEALRALQERAEEAGILVVTSSIVGNNSRRNLKVEEFRGFVLVDEYAPLIFINGSDGKAAQMFSLAHELAHLWLGTSAVFDLRDLEPASDEIEQACNRIAAEFLVPSEEMLRFWREATSQSDLFQAIAHHFKVSKIVAARRSLDLDLINREEFLAFYNEYKNQEWVETEKQEGGNFYAIQTLRLGRRFSETVIRAVREGHLLYRDAYRLTGLYGKTFENFAKHLLGDRT